MDGQPPIFDDPAAAFLAQEHDALGGLVDEIAPSQPQVKGMCLVFTYYRLI